MDATTEVKHELPQQSPTVISESNEGSQLNFADFALSLPFEVLESSLKENQHLVNVQGYGSHTALHKAVISGNRNIVQLLLKFGADPNVTTNAGDTSLHIACSRGALKLLLPLLNFGANPTLFNKNGQLPIHCAAQSGCIIVVQFMSEFCGSDLENPDANGSTVLHGACAGGHMELVRYLLNVKRVFCLNPDNNGNTILHSCVSGGNSGICWEVLAHGGECLLLAKNKNGQTPHQVAQSSLNVSRDFKKWLQKWTLQCEKKKSISTPKFEWLLLSITPLVVFHSVVIFSVAFFPQSQWIIGVPGFLLLLFIIGKQQHRINHPARWANPIYVGAYSAALLSSILCYLGSLEAHHYVPSIFFLLTIGIFSLQIYFFIRLIRGDPGTVPASGYSKDVLIRLAEDRLEGRYCPQCYLEAPTLSHHCRLCGRCFLHLDHHCLFLNTCIAANNHWHFLIFVILNILSLSFFIVTSVYLVPFSLSKVSLGDWVVQILSHWLCDGIWTFLLLLCHTASLLWGVSLLRYQYRVLSTQQTSYFRIKMGPTATTFSKKQKILNFLKFLYNKRILLTKATHYYQA